MIVDCGNGDIGFLFKLSGDYAEVLGDMRVGQMDNVLYGAVTKSAHSSFISAATGAHRWHPNFRPEVLIDSTGRLL